MFLECLLAIEELVTALVSTGKKHRLYFIYFLANVLT
jgi:hypothetical protein